MDSPGEILLLCRLCLVKDQVNIPIFEEQGDIRQIFLKISSCLPVKVSREDNLPKKICDGCSNKLDLLYEFWNTSANAEKTLLSWLGQAGVKDADETISAVAQQIAKPVEPQVKEETELLDEEATSHDATEAVSFDEELQEEESEAPPPKRARRTAAVKAQINITPESDEDEDDELDTTEDPVTKMEDSEESEDEKDQSFAELPGTSADDGAGPSGVGKDGVEAPKQEAKDENTYCDTTAALNMMYAFETELAEAGVSKKEPSSVTDLTLDDNSNDYSSLQNLEVSTSSDKKLSEKTQLIYERTYKSFMIWLKENQHQEINEEAISMYLVDLSKRCKPPSAYATYSMLKSMILTIHNINIGEYSKVGPLLKDLNKGYVVNKSKFFTKEQIHRFLKEAPDDKYLMFKAAMIIGILGACRRDDLANLTIDDIEDVGAAILVRIKDPITKRCRTFTVISEEQDQVDCLHILRKYYCLRPYCEESRRFFHVFKDGKCTNNVVGKNTIGKIPSMVAKYLQLPDPKAYTGHTYKRTFEILRKKSMRII